MGAPGAGRDLVDRAVQMLTQFTTESRTRRGVLYELVAHPDGRVLSCSCPAFTFRHDCRHASRLRGFLAEFQSVADGNPAVRRTEGEGERWQTNEKQST